MVIRSYLYLSGDWNGNRPFKYDLNDPEGKSETSRLLHYYLKTRLGNCVSMPILHAILGQRLGLDMTIASAPNHVFIIYTDKSGKQINLEATSGGHPSRLAWYKQNLPLSDRAIQTGAFMRKLNDQEAIVVMAHDLVAHLLRHKKYDEVKGILPILAKHNPRDAHIYFQHTWLYAMRVEEEFYSKYPTEEDLPPELMPKFQKYRHQEEMGLQAATNLGYFGDEREAPKPFNSQNDSNANKNDDYFKPLTDDEADEYVRSLNELARQRNIAMGILPGRNPGLPKSPTLPSFPIMILPQIED